MNLVMTWTARTAKVAAICFLLFITLLPFLWMISTAFQRNSDIFVVPPNYVPSTWTLENFETLVTDPKYTRSFLNSLVVTVVSTALTICVAAPAAYAIARHRFPGNAGGHVGNAFLLVRLLPPFALAIPLFLMMRSANLIDSVVSLIIVYGAIHLPLAIWIILPAASQIPKEISEAALMDGASTLQTFARVVLPLLRPSVATAAAFSAIFSWNEFFFALIFTFDKSRTYPVMISGLMGDAVPNWGALAASAVLASVPTVLFVVFLQRSLVGGVTAGAVK